LIFLDLNLPLVSGLQVLQKIRDTETTAAIPVVVFTSSANERDRIESYRLGANSFVVKPHTYEKFIQAVVEIAFYWTRINRVSYLEA
jgi:two-component system response regulator